MKISNKHQRETIAGPDLYATSKHLHCWVRKVHTIFFGNNFSKRPPKHYIQGGPKK